jgi:hypothetical protein
LEDAGSRRLLLVAYHFGKDCAAGGLRWNATAQGLVRKGWDLDVITLERRGCELPYTPEEGDGVAEIFPIAATDAPRAALEALSRTARRLRGRKAVERATRPLQAHEDAPPDPALACEQVETEIWRRGERRPLYERLTSTLDGIVEWSTDIVWARRALAQARQLARQRRYRAALVSTPPHYTQHVGAQLSREHRIPYIADYRDPWLLGIRWLADYVDPFERLLARSLEPRWLRRAAVVMHNTPRARSAIAADLPGGLSGLHLSVPNGYDPVGAIKAPDPDCFRIAYTGWLHPYMDPRPVLAACRTLFETRHLRPDGFRIDFVGTDSRFAGVDVNALARAYGLEACFHQRPRVPREEVRHIQQRAAVLVAYDCPHPLSVPSKFYEYAQMTGTMLLLGNPDGAMADAAAQLGPRVFELSDQRGIDAALAAAYTRWQAGELDVVMDREGRFDRRHQIATIVEALESL